MLATGAFTENTAHMMPDRETHRRRFTSSSGNLRALHHVCGRSGRSQDWSRRFRLPESQIWRLWFHFEPARAGLPHCRRVVGRPGHCPVTTILRSRKLSRAGRQTQTQTSTSTGRYRGLFRFLEIFRSECPFLMFASWLCIGDEWHHKGFDSRAATAIPIAYLQLIFSKDCVHMQQVL